MNYPNGTGSPLEKLCQADGKVVMLESPLEKITVLHHAESLANIPDKKIKRYRMPVLMPVLRNGETVWITIEYFDSSKGSPASYGEDYFRVIGREAIAAGLARQGRVGGATSYLFDARDLVDFGVEWLERTSGGNE
ncbi:MAG: AAC(3) family N-acetyltransferase [SAR202 cluster bacterium]|nr:AAC(3) family N-acetyltransferase [SAR202 cluster bacterium]